MPSLRSFLAATILILGVGLPPLRAAEALRPTAIMAQETQLVIELLEKGHYSNRPLQDADFRELIVEYMRALDSRKLFFFGGDEQAMLEKHGSNLGERMRISGAIEPAFEIFSLYSERAKARLDWVATRLAGEFDFAASDRLVIDRSKEPWPATQEEADQLWDARLRAELIELLLADKTQQEALDTVRRRYERTLKTIQEIEAAEVQEIFLSSLMQVYDPHSSFFSSETMEDFSIGMRLSLTGIGALLGVEEDYCVIRELVAGGPAKLSKQLKPGDKVVAVAQEGEEPVEVVGFKLRKVVNLIRGELGSSVTLTIVPADARDSSERRQVTLVRDTIRLDESRAHASVHELPSERGSPEKIGVITIPTFYGAEGTQPGTRVSVTDDVRELLRKLEAESVSAVVLDLRRNGGGLLTEAIELTGLFIPRGPVVQIRDGYDRRMVRSDERRGVDYAGPLVVLTDRFTASASEIVAGALQNYGRALVVGNRSTHGKGTVQQIFELRDFMNRWKASDQQVGAAKLTVQKFYLPNGDSTQRQGVLPDIVLPSVEDHMKIGESDLEHALQWDRIEASRFAPVSFKSDAIEQIRATSEGRMQALPEFSFLARSIEFLKRRQEEKELSLNLEVRRQLRDLDKSMTSEIELQGKELAALNFPSREVLLDSVAAREPQESDSAGLEPEASAAPSSEVTASAVPGAPAAETTEEEPESPSIDVHLRESLRIASDYARYLADPARFQATSTAQTSSTVP